MNHLKLTFIVNLAFIPSLLTAQQKRPNIIVFIVDDMGWEDTSVPFWNQKTSYNKMYETPNMEKLCQKGLIFTQAYACPVSSPTRCSLMTGMNMARHKVTNWTFNKNKPTDASSSTIQIPAWNFNGITKVQNIPHTTMATSFVEILNKNGYHTIHCGKAHWGAKNTPGENPLHFGFEINIAGHFAGGLETYLSEFNYGHSRDGKPISSRAIPGLEQYWGTGTFATEALTQEAIKALNKAKQYDQPFYLYMSHYAIHIPIDKDMRYFPKYVRKGLSDKDAAYASLIEGMDKSLGDIMDWLKVNKEDKNTVIIFLGDNGGLAASTRWREGKPHTQNYPLKSGKGSLYEGGIRVPFIIKWPGIVKENKRNDKYIMIEDLYPTILEIAGIKNYKVPQIIDGQSIMPLLKDTKDISRDRSLIWNFPNIWDATGPGINLNCAIRKNEWKLIYYYETGKKELFNITKDINENNNLAPQYPDLVKRLSQELGTRLRKMNAQRPSFKKTNRPCPWPDESMPSMR